MITVFIFIFGTIIGSFLNVCIVRLPNEDPQRRSVIFPRSHCPHCKHLIPWFANIPLVSFLALRGKCLSCQSKISFRYFIVEFLTGIGFVIFYRHFGPTLVLIPYLVMFCGCVVATFVDLEHRIIPDEISVGGMLAGLLLSLLVPAMHQVSASVFSFAGLIAGIVLACNMVLLFFYPLICPDLVQDRQAEDHANSDSAQDAALFNGLIFAMIAGLAIILIARNFFVSLAAPILSLGFSLAGALIGGGVVHLMGLAGDMIFKKESMGGGDVKFMAMVGAFLGWPLTLLGFFIAPFFGAIFGIIVKIRTQQSMIPYGPFLAVGSLIALFFSEQILRWIFTIYGIS